MGMNLVIETVQDVLRDHGIAPGEIGAETVLLRGAGLDSLGLAEVIVRLEEKTGKDPFQGGFVNFQTVGELAALYDAV